MAKKHIMDLPTNVPRLKEGAGLFGGEVYDETKAPDIGKKGAKKEAFKKHTEISKGMPIKNIKPKDNFSGIVFGFDKPKFKQDTREYRKKQSSPLNKEFYDLFRKGKPKIEDYSNPLPKPKKKLSI